VFLEEIVTDPASDDPTVFLEGISVAGAHAGGHLEENVDELPELKVVVIDPRQSRWLEDWSRSKRLF